MRTKLTSRLSLLFVSFAMLLALPAMAFADQIANNVDATVDATAEVMALQVGATTGNTTQLSVIPTESGSKNGCDLTGSNTVTAAVDSSNPAVATVSPNSVTFGSCGETKTLTVTPKAQGTTTISLRQTATTTGATFDMAPATFTVNVSAAPPSNTPPQVQVNGVTHGDAYEKGSVPAASCQVTDAEDSNESATPVIDSGSLNSHGLGQQTVTCSYTDAGGLEASSSKTYTIVDTTKPVIAAHADVTEEATGPGGATVNYAAPTADDAVFGPVDVSCTPASGGQFPLGSTLITCNATDGSGNTAAPVTFNVRVADTTAPKLDMPEDKTVEATGPNGAAVGFARTASDIVDGPVAVSCEANGSPVKGGDTFALGTTNVDCTATDKAGNTASDSFAVKVEDTTAPKLSLPSNITEEATGPNGNAVNYDASADDLVSGKVDVTCQPASGSTFPMGTTNVDCTATDKAGNKATGSFAVKVEDTTAPNNIRFVGNIGDGDSFFFGDAPAQPTCEADDGGSGLQSCVVTGYKAAVGTHKLTATATDKAGNAATREISYTVKPYTLNGFYQPIDMNGTVNTVKNGSTVPAKFELFKGATELTSTSSISSISAKQVNCAGFNGDPVDAIETTATGATSLRYDATGGQFVYNWQTPKGASQVGKCYSLTMTTADNSSMTAYFKLK